QTKQNNKTSHVTSCSEDGSPQWCGPLGTSATAQSALWSRAKGMGVQGTLPMTLLPGDLWGLNRGTLSRRCSRLPPSQIWHLGEAGAGVESMKENKVAIAGKIHTPREYKGELAPYDMRLRPTLDSFANIVHVKSLPGYKTQHNSLDLVTIRKQTEGEYSSLEHESARAVSECLKTVTRTKLQRIAKFTFDYANSMKLGDGLFLQCCEEVAELYPKMKFETTIIDNCCMQLVQNPYQFDVLVMPNLYGNIIDNLAAGLIGGAGVVPGESYSAEYAVFEMGPRHPFAQVVGRNTANPTATLPAASNTLRHLSLEYRSNMIAEAVKKVIKVGKMWTRDMSSYGTRTDFKSAPNRCATQGSLFLYFYICP
uniref:Isopropylmalate dehydrogenase-like domain-containing protein n=1 Tax=Canis lupus familiaris TaxID=9615 RepID=A0A8C0SEN6_CANLF